MEIAGFKIAIILHTDTDTITVEPLYKDTSLLRTLSFAPNATFVYLTTSELRTSLY